MATKKKKINKNLNRVNNKKSFERLGSTTNQVVFWVVFVVVIVALFLFASSGSINDQVNPQAFVDPSVCDPTSPNYDPANYDCENDDVCDPNSPIYDPASEQCISACPDGDDDGDRVCNSYGGIVDRDWEQECTDAGGAPIGEHVGGDCQYLCSDELTVEKPSTLDNFPVIEEVCSVGGDNTSGGDDEVITVSGDDVVGPEAPPAPAGGDEFVCGVDDQETVFDGEAIKTNAFSS